MKKETQIEIRDQIIFVICFIGAWYVISKAGLVHSMVFPTPGEIAKSFVEGFSSGGLMSYTLFSLALIARGLAIGIVLAFVLSSLSMVSRHFYAVYNFVVSIFDLLPGVALLPVVLSIFGICETTIIIIVVHSILWPMSRSLMDGFKTVPSIYIESGNNIGLRGMRLVLGVYLPAAFGSVLSGLRVGWARAWRGLLAVEMIFGTTGTGAGVGWYIFMRRVNLDYSGLYAALLVIIIIGVIIEYGVFRTVERNTIKKWGMSA